MSKPSDISAEAWEAAVKCAETALRNMPDDYGDLTVEITAIARAIEAAEQRGADRQREVDAKRCDDFAETGIRLWADAGDARADLHLAQARAAQTLAAAIRSTKG